MTENPLDEFRTIAEMVRDTSGDTLLIPLETALVEEDRRATAALDNETRELALLFAEAAGVRHSPGAIAPLYRQQAQFFVSHNLYVRVSASRAK